jgi:hypothetical protein
VERAAEDLELSQFLTQKQNKPLRANANRGFLLLCRLFHDLDEDDKEREQDERLNKG